MLNREIQTRFVDNPETARLNFLTHEDCRELARKMPSTRDEQLYIVSAPRGAELEVSTQNNEEYPHQLFVTTRQGEIDVFLCSPTEGPALLRR
jgi:hypothetical protein